MSRRHERALKRLERIHHRRLLEQGERIRECLARDGCQVTDCMYFALPEDFEELISFACDVLAEEFGTLENKSENACAFAKETDPETDPEPETVVFGRKEYERVKTTYPDFEPGPNCFRLE